MSIDILSQKVVPGLQLVVAGWIGMDNVDPEIASVISETALEYKALTYELSKDGIFDALWALGRASGLGVEVEASLIPVRQETIEQCENSELNPYRIPSKGCFLMAVADSFGLVRALHDRDIYASVIGHLTEGNDRVVIFRDHVQYLGSGKDFDRTAGTDKRTDNAAKGEDHA